MILMKAYRNLSVACHVLRLITILTLVAQMIAWRPDVTSETVLYKCNSAFPYAFVGQLAY